MSSSDEYNFSSDYDESSDDETYYLEQHELEIEKRLNEESHYLIDEFSNKNIYSPLLGPFDSKALNECLSCQLNIEDVVQLNRVRFQNKIALGCEISEERIQDFKHIASLLILHYAPEKNNDNVAAGLIRYTYNL